jgi:hypothetical protein
MIKKILLIVIIIISLPISFYFGLLKTGNGHTGYFSGLPFGLIIIILCFSSLVILDERRIIIFETLGFSLFICMCFFMITMGLVISNNKNYYDVLYSGDNGSSSNKIFWIYIFLAIITSIRIIVYRFKKLDKNE